MENIEKEVERLARALLAEERGLKKMKLSGYYSIFSRKAKKGRKWKYKLLAKTAKNLLEVL